MLDYETALYNFLFHYLSSNYQNTVSFDYSLEKDMDRYESQQQDHKTTPPLYPHEDPSEQTKSPQQPHRRSANANIFNTNKDEVGGCSKLYKGLGMDSPAPLPLKSALLNKL